MCTFVTATVNADADPALVQATLRSHGVRFVETPAPKGVPAHRIYLADENGQCDCGTMIGRGFREEEPPYTPNDLAKLRKKNWSRARIERWKAQRLDAEAEYERVERHRLEAARHDLTPYVDLVRAMLDTPTVRVFGLMHDWYSSGPESEQLPLTVEPPQPVAGLTEERLFRLPGGTLLEWTR